MKIVEQNRLQLKLQERRKNGKIFFKLGNTFFLIKQCLNNISGIPEGAFVLVMNRDALGSLQAVLAAGVGCWRFACSRGTGTIQPALQRYTPRYS